MKNKTALEHLENALESLNTARRESGSELTCQEKIYIASLSVEVNGIIDIINERLNPKYFHITCTRCNQYIGLSKEEDTGQSVCLSCYGKEGKNIGIQFY